MSEVVVRVYVEGVLVGTETVKGPLSVHKGPKTEKQSKRGSK